MIDSQVEGGAFSPSYSCSFGRDCPEGAQLSGWAQAKLAIRREQAVGSLFA